MSSKNDQLLNEISELKLEISSINEKVDQILEILQTIVIVDDSDDDDNEYENNEDWVESEEETPWDDQDD